MQLTQRGDTIVEVLIALAVIGSVLGAAYGITNRNVNNGQQSEEHSQALKVAETQLEQLKSFIATSGSVLPDPATNFCINAVSGGATNGLDITDFPINDPLPLANLSDYPSDCSISDNGVSDRYKVGIRQDAATKAFTVYVVWDGATGHVDQLSLSYKAYN